MELRPAALCGRQVFALADLLSVLVSPVPLRLGVDMFLNFSTRSRRYVSWQTLHFASPVRSLDRRVLLIPRQCKLIHLLSIVAINHFDVPPPFR